jgi:phosphoglycerate kinase
MLAGAKPDDVCQLLKFACTSLAVDKVLTSGVLGELCLVARGVDLGSAKNDFFKKEGFDKLIPELKDYISKYSIKIETPLDVAIEENGARKEYAISEVASKADGKLAGDIGSRTISRYQQIIATSKTIYFKGPVGIYENPIFENGTREILRAIEKSAAFKFMGGGHSISAVEKFGINKSRISHISLAGGAVVEYLQGKKLPAVEMLKKAYLRDKDKFGK